ncbi:MAG: hypothetical protein ABL970_02320 [Nitrospira sp.]
MNTFQATAIAACLITLSGLTHAGDSHYECTVLSTWTLTQYGGLEPHWTNKSMVGNKFTVDRITGRIIGGPLDNANLQIEVIDRGTREMSFQALSRSTQKTHTTHIEIQEFLSGTEKPFVGMTTLYYPGVYSGICW